MSLELFPTIEPADARADLALEVHRRLCDAYGCPVAYFHSLDPLGELVSSLLSHRTKNSDSGRAFRQLCNQFGVRESKAWDGVADGDVAAVELAIAPCTWPEHKAPTIQHVLRAVREKVGRLDETALDFLGDLSVPDARAWLESFRGVGRKTSAAVLSFSRLRMAALPVDSHHHRVAQRLGLIGPKVDVAAAHDALAALLPPDFDAQQTYDHHEVLMFHGQRVCHWRNPACAACVLLDLCPTGRARTGGPGSTPASGSA